MLWASLGISTKSVGDRLKVGLFTIFVCVQLAFRNVAAVPREASRAQKSPCPAITSSSASTAFNVFEGAWYVFSWRGKFFSAGPNWVKNFFQSLYATAAKTQTHVPKLFQRLLQFCIFVSFSFVFYLKIFSLVRSSLIFGEVPCLI